MEKKLLREIVVCFCVSGLLLLSIFSVLLYVHEDNRRTKDINIVFKQFEAVYEKSEERMLKKQAIIETDYITRGKAVDFFLKHSPEKAIPYGLQELCSCLNVSQIHLLNKDGRIAVSSLPGASGSKLADSAEGNRIRELIEGGEGQNWTLLGGEYIFNHIATQNYAVIKSSLEAYPIILVGINDSDVKEMKAAIDVGNVMGSISAMQDQMFLVIDRDTYRVLGGTREEYRGTRLTEETMEKLLSAKKRRPARLFDNLTFVKSSEYRNMLLVSVQLYNNGIRLVIQQIILSGLLLLLVFGLLVFVIRRFFKNYIFREFKMIEKTIENSLTGETAAQFYTSQNTEVRELVEALNKFMERNIDLNQQIQLSSIDAVTGLVNRSGFEKYIGEYIKKSGGQGVMLMMDIDNFKAINDNMGHPEGDRVLKIAADYLKSEFQDNGMVVRLGGDEFAVLLGTAVPPKRLKEKADRLLRNLREAVPDYYQKYNVSASIGIAVFEQGLTDYQELYQGADEALYEAKRNGKNRCRIQLCTGEEPVKEEKTKTAAEAEREIETGEGTRK